MDGSYSRASSIRSCPELPWNTPWRRRPLPIPQNCAATSRPAAGIVELVGPQLRGIETPKHMTAATPIAPLCIYDPPCPRAIDDCSRDHIHRQGGGYRSDVCLRVSASHYG